VDMRLAAGMRVALLLLGVVALVAFAAFAYQRIRHKPPVLTIAPTGRPQCHSGMYGQIDVSMVVGVTNNSRSSLLVGVGVTSPQSGYTFRSTSREIVQLKPGCGTLWPVTYNSSGPKPQVLGGDYLRIQGRREIRARALLFKLGVPGIGTNDSWVSVVAGQVVYE
jgi:hypothetical protein